MRSLNYDRLRLDLQATEKAFQVAHAGDALDMATHEYVIAKTGDSVL